MSSKDTQPICRCGHPLSEGTQHGIDVWYCRECGEVQPREDDIDDTSPWRPAELHAPELLDVLMHMDTVTLGAVEIQMYKHSDTRRYLCLDLAGWAWRITTAAEGNTVARSENLDHAKAFVRGEVKR